VIHLEFLAAAVFLPVHVHHLIRNSSLL
jgi:uncharacterized membrane protein (DUF2068 family)